MFPINGDITPPWGAPMSRFSENTIFNHTRPEKSLNDVKNVPICDFGPKHRHDDIVRNIVKESFDVNIHHELVSFVEYTEEHVRRLDDNYGRV